MGERELILPHPPTPPTPPTLLPPNSSLLTPNSTVPMPHAQITLVLFVRLGVRVLGHQNGFFRYREFG
ncbi:MAG: hypothetical protein RMY29_008200, partial [Nostoc sp. CreGUA01]